MIDGLLQSRVMNQTFHAAGPERLNRVEIGKRVAQVFGYPDPLITPSRLPRSFELGESDDVALRTGKIREAIGIQFTPVFAGLYKTYHRWKKHTESNENLP